MRQIHGGVIHGINSVDEHYFIHLSTGIKVECRIQNSKQENIYLIPAEVTNNDLKRCIDEYGLSISFVKDLEKKLKDESLSAHNQELIDCDKYQLNGIYEIIYAIHKYYFPETKKVECQITLRDEVYHVTMQYSK